MTATVRITLTENDLEEGGRPRDPLEVYLTLNAAQRAFFPERERFGVTTDDLRRFEASVTGNSGAGTPAKNLRSIPATRFGEWLKRRKRARAGDRVEVTRLDNGRYFFRHLPQGVHRGPGPTDGPGGDAPGPWRRRVTEEPDAPAPVPSRPPRRAPRPPPSPGAVPSPPWPSWRPSSSAAGRPSSRSAWRCWRSATGACSGSRATPPSPTTAGSGGGSRRSGRCS